MKDEEEDNIIPNEDENFDNQDSPANEEGFDDIRVSTGHHFYENNENPEDTITKVTGMYKDWFLVKKSVNISICSCIKNE